MIGLLSYTEAADSLRIAPCAASERDVGRRELGHRIAEPRRMGNHNPSRPWGWANRDGSQEGVCH